MTDPGEGADGPEGSEGGSGATGTATAGENLALLTAGSPQDVLAIWLDAFDAVFADATAPVLDDLAGVVTRTGRSTSRRWSGTRRRRPSSWRAYSATCIC